MTDETGWNARGIGLEGRTDWEMWLPPNQHGWPPHEIEAPHHKRLSVGWLSEEADPTTCPYDVVVYHLEQQADDGTLIYRRITPAFKDGKGV